MKQAVCSSTTIRNYEAQLRSTPRGSDTPNGLGQSRMRVGPAEPASADRGRPDNRVPARLSEARS